MAKLSMGEVKHVFQDSIVISFERHAAIIRLVQMLLLTNLKLFDIRLHSIAIILPGN